MSPLYIAVRSSADSELKGLASKVANKPNVVMNVRNITIVDVGCVIQDSPMYSANKGQLVGCYRCAHNGHGYTLTRVTGGDYEIISYQIKTLKDCQQLALLDHCDVNKLSAIKQIYRRKRY